MKTVKVIRQTVCSGIVVEVGKTYSLSDFDAGMIVRMGKAVFVVPEKAPAADGPPKPDHREKDLDSKINKRKAAKPRKKKAVKK